MLTAAQVIYLQGFCKTNVFLLCLWKSQSESSWARWIQFTLPFFSKD